MEPSPPWFAIPALPERIYKQAAVIGGGLAGTAVAQALAERGWRVTLLERHATLAAEASGHHAGVLMPRIEVGPSISQRWFAAACRYALEHLIRLGRSVDWSPCGVLLAAWNPRILQRQLTLLKQPSPWPLHSVDSKAASRLCGFPVPWQGVYLPQAGWAHPPGLCRAQSTTDHSRINVLLGQEVTKLEHDRSLWRLLDGQGNEIAQAPVVIIANGTRANHFSQTRGLPLQPVRGQITEFSATAASRRLKTVVCGPGYVIPAREGKHCIGATYDPSNRDSEPSITDRQTNIIRLRQLLPALADCPKDSPSQERVAFRAVAPDHLPLLGPVPDETAFRETYADLRHGRPHSRYPPAPCHPGLYISAGYGSQGLVSTPLAAALLATMIDQGNDLMDKDLLHALHPARFLVRELKRAGP